MTKTSLNVKLQVAFGLNIKCLLREIERKKKKNMVVIYKCVTAQPMPNISRSLG